VLSTPPPPAADPEPGTRRRIGVVLGAGGHAGIAFHSGVLLSLEHHIGFSANDADVLVGTSAGSVIAGLLAHGFTPEDLAAFTAEVPLSAGRIHLEPSLRESAAARAVHRWLNLITPVSPLVALRLLRNLPRVRPAAAVAALLNGPIDPGRSMAAFDELGITWPERDTFIVAVRRDGRRAVFGRPDSPTATLSQAIAASCAIPGFYAPVRIGRHSYIDGGAHSTTNADLLADRELDTVLVIAPMGAASNGASMRRADGVMRRAVNRRLAGELARIRRAGTDVVVISPTEAELRAMGLNAMNRARAKPVLREAFLTTGERIARGEIDLRALSPRRTASGLRRAG